MTSNRKDILETIDLPVNPIEDFSVDFNMASPTSSIKYMGIISIVPEKTQEVTYEEPGLKNYWEEKSKKENELLKNFGIFGIGKACRELRDLTGAGMMDCKKCLIKSANECKIYTKKALFDLAIEYLKALPPIYL